MVRLTDRPDMTLDVYRGRKTTIQQHTTKLVFKETMLKRQLSCQSGNHFGDTPSYMYLNIWTTLDVCMSVRVLPGVCCIDCLVSAKRTHL